MREYNKRPEVKEKLYKLKKNNPEKYRVNDAKASRKYYYTKKCKERRSTQEWKDKANQKSKAYKHRNVEKIKKYKQDNRDSIRKLAKKLGKKYRERLVDHYLLKLIKENTSLNRCDIPKEVIETKRLIIKLKRELNYGNKKRFII